MIGLVIGMVIGLVIGLVIGMVMIIDNTYDCFWFLSSPTSSTSAAPGAAPDFALPVVQAFGFTLPLWTFPLSFCFCNVVDFATTLKSCTSSWFLATSRGSGLNRCNGVFRDRDLLDDLLSLDDLLPASGDLDGCSESFTCFVASSPDTDGDTCVGAVFISVDALTDAGSLDLLADSAALDDAFTCFVAASPDTDGDTCVGAVFLVGADALTDVDFFDVCFGVVVLADDATLRRSRRRCEDRMRCDELPLALPFPFPFPCDFFLFFFAIRM